MTNKEILTKAIRLAIDSGFDIYAWNLAELPWKIEAGQTYHLNPGFKNMDSDSWLEINTIIFNHDFAKALWGEPKIMTHKEIREAGFSGGGGGTMTDMKQAGWQYHLQQMVISEDAIKYLGENI